MEHCRFFGLKLSIFTRREIDKYIIDTVNSSSNKILFGWGFGQIPLIKQYSTIFDDTNATDLSVCDGINMYRYAKLLGYNLKDFVSIPELVNISLKAANENHYSVFLLGAKKEVNESAIQNIKLKYPNITVFGRDGYFKAEDVPEIINSIKSTRSNIVLIGISSPIKESLGVEFRNTNTGNIILPCGGMIDVIAGKTKQTPALIKKLGLAMFYRVIQEPRRLLVPRIILTFEVFFKIIPVTIYYHIFNDGKYSIEKFYTKKNR